MLAETLLYLLLATGAYRARSTGLTPRPREIKLNPLPGLYASVHISASGRFNAAKWVTRVRAAVKRPPVLGCSYLRSGSVCFIRRSLS